MNHEIVRFAARSRDRTILPFSISLPSNLCPRPFHGITSLPMSGDAKSAQTAVPEAATAHPDRRGQRGRFGGWAWTPPAAEPEADDEEESSKEDDAKPFTKEEKQQLKRQLWRYIRSRRWGGPRHCRHQHFNRLWGLRKGFGGFGPHQFSGYGGPPCGGFGGPTQFSGYGGPPCGGFGPTQFGGFGGAPPEFGGFEGQYPGFGGYGGAPHCGFGGPPPCGRHCGKKGRKPEEEGADGPAEGRGKKGRKCGGRPHGYEGQWAAPEWGFGGW
jgi:hypothetical protein